MEGEFEMLPLGTAGSSAALPAVGVGIAVGLPSILLQQGGGLLLSVSSSTDVLTDKPPLMWLFAFLGEFTLLLLVVVVDI